MHKLTAILFFLLSTDCLFSQSIDKYFLGIPYRQSNKVQLDFVKSQSRFRPSYKSDYPEWMYFDAEYLDNRAIDPECDSIKVVLTSGFGNFVNEDRTMIIFFYQSRGMQYDKFLDLEYLLKYQYRQYDSVTLGDETNPPEYRVRGSEFWLSSDRLPKIGLYQTTDEGYFQVMLVFAQDNGR